MIEKEELAGKIFSLLKGNGLKIKIFDETGTETTDPQAGRRFFVIKPNIMVTIDDDSNTVEFSKGKDVNNETLGIQKNVRKLADQFMMNSKIKVFGKSIQPRDYAYQAKKQGASMMENNQIKPINHHLVGEVIRMIKTFTSKNHQHHQPNGAAFHDICSNLGEEPEDIQPVLNRLVQQGKVIATPYKGYNIYSMVVDEAVMESIPDVDHMNGPRAPHKNTNCTTCHGRKFLYKTADGQTYADNKVGAKRISCPACKGTGDALKESFSKMFGSLKTSQQTLENVRILVKHKTPVDENVRGSRSRHIGAIFLECNGERFRFPNTYLPGARAMAQHLAHGGTMGDKVGSYITESIDNLLKLQSFNRYVTVNKLINEDSSGIVETVKENIETIRTELKKLTGVKTYETVKARLETFERQDLSEDDTSHLKDLFTIRRFDEKFEGVLPIIKQLVSEKDTYHKRIEESAANIVMIRRESMNKVPMFEFASENAKLGFKINELALRIIENEELAGFVNKIGTKICKEGIINSFEKAVLAQVFENIQISEKTESVKKDIKESIELDVYFDKYIMNFY